ncbi:MAG TPA: DsrE family protein [Usitatibacter sp.]|nr:DsrE family protein [Usitatibacter sp.]
MDARGMFAGACAMLALALPGCAQTGQPAQADAARQRVVFQVSDGDPGKWNLALNNARNVQQDVGAKNVDIEIVAYGPGIGMLKKNSAVSQRIDEATMSGMKVVACENTMHAQKLSKADMLEGIGYVPAGVVEIMKKQQEGWAYVRP